DAQLVGDADDRLDVGQDCAGGAVGGNRELLITNLACQSAHLFDDPWTGTRQANVSRHNAEVGHEVQEALFDLEGGIGDRGGLQPVAQRLVVQVNAGTGPIEVAIRAARVGPVVDGLPLLHGSSVAPAPSHVKLHPRHTSS